MYKPNSKEKKCLKAWQKLNKVFSKHSPFLDRSHDGFGLCMAMVSVASHNCKKKKTLKITKISDIPNAFLAGNTVPIGKLRKCIKALTELQSAFFTSYPKIALTLSFSEEQNADGSLARHMPARVSILVKREGSFVRTWFPKTISLHAKL